MAEIATKLFSWLNKRLPIVNTFERHLSKHPVPSKVNFWYLFGALAAVTLIIQIVNRYLVNNALFKYRRTGIFIY